MTDFVKELIEFLDDIVSGKATIEDARKRAAVLQAKKPETLTDELLAELDGKIAALEAKTAPPFVPGDIPGSSER